MGQQEIFELLKENPGRFYTVNQISNELNVASNNISRQVIRLSLDRYIELRNVSLVESRIKYAIRFKIVEVKR